MRGSARKKSRNQSVSSRLHTLEKKYLAALAGGKKDEASTALRAASSALDKAVKAGVITRSLANRKKSRLAVKLKK